MKLPSPAMFVSVAALVVAMSGSSYAAIKISGNEIEAKSINSSRIQKNTLGSGVIKDGTIKKKDLEPGTIGDSRWAYVGANGVIQAQSGGFTMVAAYPTLANTATDGSDNSLRANGNVYINAGADLGNTAITATVVLQNTNPVNAGRNAGADANPTFSGEIAVSRCNAAGTPGPTNCAPTGAQNLSSFVVSPRLSDGQPTGLGGADNRKGFYVILTK